MKETQQVKAHEVEDGDFIPGLDNAYVFEVDFSGDLRTQDNVSVTSGMVTITAHDQNGDEITLILPPESRLTISRS